MADGGTGFGAGFAQGAAQGEEINVRRQALQQETMFRGAELALRAQEYERQMMVLNRQTAQDNLKTVEAQHNALMAAVTKGLENQGDKLQQDPATWAGLLSHVQVSAARLAGAMANAMGGDAKQHLQDVTNEIAGTLTATGTPAAVAMNKALADFAGTQTSLSAGTPSLQGKAEGQKALSAAQSGGAAAAGATRAAEEAVTPRVMTPEQRMVVPPPGSIPGVGATPNVAAGPGASVAMPNLSMPPAPRVPVQSAPLAAPQAAPQIGGPGAPAGTVIPPMMMPATVKAEEALGANFGSENEQKAYRGAQSGLQNLYQIMAGIDKLQKTGGFQAPGSGADLRNEMAKAANTMATVLGVPPPFDASTVASWEDVAKNTRLMGMQVISSFFGGSREAASIVNAGINSVPGAQNTYLGAREVASGVEQALQRSIALHDFTAQQVAQNKMISTAETEFNRLNPPQLYAMRAMANAVPDDHVKILQANPSTVAQFDQRFGRGVGEFILKGGRTGLGGGGF